jgi:hypothetical protein
LESGVSDKSPRKGKAGQKPALTLKEKRAVKDAKKEQRRREAE